MKRKKEIPKAIKIPTIGKCANSYDDPPYGFPQPIMQFVDYNQGRHEAWLRRVKKHVR